MKKYTLTKLSLPLDDTWDVIVAGGGPAGCTAAATAAREGARTLLIESTGSLGGSGTSALVPAWCPFSDKEKIIYRGMAEKVFSAGKEGMAHVGKEDLDWVPIDPEKLKRVYDDLVLGYGVTVLFHTVLSTVETDGQGGVSTLIVTNKSGLSALQAKVYVDCTGDADITAWAGGDFQQGGKLMPATHCFALANVNEEVYLRGPNLHPANPDSPIWAILKSGKYPLIPDSHLCSNLTGPGTVGFNAGHIWEVDNTKTETVSKAMSKGRKIAAAFRDALAEFYPEAFGNSYLVMTGSSMGIRETRRITGDYVLTLKDYLERKSFEDEICRNSYFIDVHWAKEEAATSAENFWDFEKKHAFRYEKGESHGIPYRCLTPKRLKNVLVAGRSISCEQIVQGSVRVMPVCLAMGEAAGIAAAHAVKYHHNDVHAVDTRRLRKRLREEGAYLPECKGETKLTNTAGSFKQSRENVLCAAFPC